MNIIMLGGPGSGKGTYSKYLSKHYNLKHISTGDLLRAETKKGTPLGVSISQRIDKGFLVDNEQIAILLEQEIEANDSCNGYIFDGYPRNLEQAEGFEVFLDKHTMHIDKVYAIEVDEKTIIQRLKKRAEIEGREDDKSEDVLRQRLNTYHSDTKPVIEYYKAKGMLVTFDVEYNDITKDTEAFVKLLEQTLQLNQK